jgi:hypothetical protein
MAKNFGLLGWRPAAYAQGGPPLGNGPIAACGSSHRTPGQTRSAGVSPGNTATLRQGPLAAPGPSPPTIRDDAPGSSAPRIHFDLMNAAHHSIAQHDVLSLTSLFRPSHKGRFCQHAISLSSLPHPDQPLILVEVGLDLAYINVKEAWYCDGASSMLLKFVWLSLSVASFWCVTLRAGWGSGSAEWGNGMRGGVGEATGRTSG